MAAAPVRGDWQGQPLKQYTVTFAHRSLKLFAERIVQVVPEPAEVVPEPAEVVPEPAEGMPLSRQATKADPGSRGGWMNPAL